MGGVGPLEFEAGGLGGDPYLADWGVGGDDELAGAVLEDDVHDAVVVLELEGAGVVFGGDEGLLEGLEGVVGFAAEGGFVDHRVSVAGLVWGVPPPPSILLKIFETNEISPDLGLELWLGDRVGWLIVGVF